MTTRPASEFNLTGAPSEEMKRKLLYLATIGSESVTSGFTKVSGMEADAKGKADWGDQSVMMMAEMATEDRVRRLEERLDRLEQETIEALQENEEKLREAEENLEQIEAAALTITMPDGTMRKVYRDGDRVRFEDGSIVDPEMVAAEEVSDDPSQWSERQAYSDAIIAMEAKREELLDLQDHIDTKQDRVRRGGLTAEESAEIGSALDEAEAAIERPYSTADSGARPDEPDALAEKQPAVTSPASTPVPGSGG